MNKPHAWSDREASVLLRMRSDGKPVKDIASKLGLSYAQVIRKINSLIRRGTIESRSNATKNKRSS